MDRREFLKWSVAAIGLLFVRKALSWLPDAATPTTPMKEALFYRPADDLAG